MYYLYNYLQDATTYKDRYDNYKYMSQDLVVNIIKKHIQLLMTDPDYFAFDYTFSGPNTGFILRSDWWDEVIENYNIEFIAIPSNADIANSRGYLGKLGLESDPLANANIETNDETVGGYDQTDYGTYQQGTSWPTIEPVVNPTKFVKYDGENCLILAKRQLAGLGFQISGYGAPGQTYNANIYPGGVNISETKAGVAYMRGALQAGIPVIVGIDYMNGVPVDRNGNPANPDLKTDHFVVIVGMGSDANGKFFRFYDSATAARVIGTSANNKLYYNETTGVISGTTEVAFAEAFRRGVPQYRDNNNKVIYTITHIRRSKSL
ncbi:MAG: hypothetical protein EOP45_11955 [Sphingobacteriaceae bacterium]|nr:MAG: hypothetical protein EOP45_11955 [Sphingobacteriaceae bacterium]